MKSKSLRKTAIISRRTSTNREYKMVLRVQYFRNSEGKNFWEVVDTYRGVTVAEAFKKTEAIKKAENYSQKHSDGEVDVQVLNTDDTHNRTIHPKGRSKR